MALVGITPTWLSLIQTEAKLITAEGHPLVALVAAEVEPQHLEGEVHRVTPRVLIVAAHQIHPIAAVLVVGREVLELITGLGARLTRYRVRMFLGQLIGIQALLLQLLFWTMTNLANATKRSCKKP